MRRLGSIEQLRHWRRSLGGSLGLVPTMGALHEGHLSLVRRSAAENDHTLATIFVNPAQFDDDGDLARYPRDLAGDATLLAAASCGALFAPSVAQIYPPGFQTRVEVGELARPLEGAARPGHLGGVATVVTKLLNLAQPDRAYFGAKDAQQLAVVRRLVRDLDLPVTIVGCDTVREPDGLAMSSRNRALAGGDRVAAASLYRALDAARAAWREGERDAHSLRRSARAVLEADAVIRIEYVSVADPEELGELDRVDPATGALVSLAAWVGGVRLIDNLTLEPHPAIEPRRGRSARPTAPRIEEPTPC